MIEELLGYVFDEVKHALYFKALVNVAKLSPDAERNKTKKKAKQSKKKK